MGSGIAQTMAAAGFEVALHDITDALVQKGIGAIEKHLSTSVEKGKLAGPENLWECIFSVLYQP